MSDTARTRQAVDADDREHAGKRGGGMSGAVRPVYLHLGNQAQALGAALRRLGFTTMVLTSRAHRRHPCVTVGSGPDRAAHRVEHVYGAPDDDGDWWFWRPSPDDPVVMERVAPLSDVSVTADAIARVLTSARASRQAS